MDNIITVLFSIWEIIVVLGVICTLGAVFFSGNSIKELFTKPPFKQIAFLCIAILMLSGFTNLRCNKVPDVTGLDYSEAVSRLREASFNGELALNNEYDSTKLIMKQDVAGGTVKIKGTKITLSYSEEETLVANEDNKVVVPNVVGMEQHSAAELLKDSNLQFKIYWEDNADFRYSNRYYVYSQSIPADSLVPEGTAVSLQLLPNNDADNSLEGGGEKINEETGSESNGVGMGQGTMRASGPNTEGKVTVPNVIGLEQNEATDQITRLGLNFQVTWGEETNNVDSSEYYVIEQSVPANSVIGKGSLIVLTLSAFKDDVPAQVDSSADRMVSVPAMVDLEQNEAVKLLVNSGLDYEVWWKEEGGFYYTDNYYVIGQSIPAGTLIPEGTKVRLQIFPLGS